MIALAIGKITSPYGRNQATVGMHDRRNTSDEIHEVEFGFLLLLCVADGSHYILAAENTIFTAYNGR